MTTELFASLVESVTQLCGVLIGLCIVLCFFFVSRFIIGIVRHIHCDYESDEQRLTRIINACLDERAERNNK